MKPQPNYDAVMGRKDGLETALDIIKRKGKNDGVPALESRIGELEDLFGGEE